MHYSESQPSIRQSKCISTTPDISCCKFGVTCRLRRHDYCSKLHASPKPRISPVRLEGTKSHQVAGYSPANYISASTSHVRRELRHQIHLRLPQNADLILRLQKQNLKPLLDSKGLTCGVQPKTSSKHGSRFRARIRHKSHILVSHKCMPFFKLRKLSHEPRSPSLLTLSRKY